MFTFETADQKEVRRFRIAQFNGRIATVRSGGSTITGHVRSVLESKSIPHRWTITIVPSAPKVAMPRPACTPSWKISSELARCAASSAFAAGGGKSSTTRPRTARAVPARQDVFKRKPAPDVIGVETGRCQENNSNGSGGPPRFNRNGSGSRRKDATAPDGRGPRCFALRVFASPRRDGFRRSSG